MTDDAVCHVLQIIPYRTSSGNSGKREKNAKLNPRNATGDVSIVFLKVIIISMLDQIGKKCPQT